MQFGKTHAKIICSLIPLITFLPEPLVADSTHANYTECMSKLRSDQLIEKEKRCERGKRGKRGRHGRHGKPGARGPQGVVGPVGSTGATGSSGSFSPNYISSWSQSQPLLLAASVPTPIIFDVDRISNGITHVSHTPTFTITTSGNYLVTWSFRIANASADFINLDVQVNGIAVEPSAIDQQFFPLGVVGTMSGSVLIPLSAGDVVQLVATSLAGDCQLAFQTIAISQQSS